MEATTHYFDGPTDTRTDIKLTIKAREARKGDRFVGQPNRMIESVESKTKWSNIHFLAGDKLRIENDAEIKILREQATEESVRNSRIQRYAEDVMDEIAKAARSVQQPTCIDPNQNWISSDLESVTKQHVRWRFIYRPILEDIGRELDNGEVVNLIDSLHNHVKYLKRQLMENRWRGQSTSTISNYVDEITREVVSDWLTSYSGVGVCWLVQLVEEEEALR